MAKKKYQDSPQTTCLPVCLFVARFSSCVVTLPSASCTEHCLSGHAWLFIWVCLCLCVCVCVRANAADQPRQRRGRRGEDGSIGEDAHTSVLSGWGAKGDGEGGTGRGRGDRGRKSGEVGEDRKTETEKQGGKGGERLYPSVLGRQPSAQIRPVGMHSLYTCSNQLATTTCLSGSFTLRHTHALAEVGASRQRVRGGVQLFGECRQGSDIDAGSVRSLPAVCSVKTTGVPLSNRQQPPSP